MKTAAPLPVLPPPATGTWRDRLLALADRWTTRPAFYRWAISNRLARRVTQRRAQALFDLMAGFVNAQVLLACVRLRLFETVLDRPRTLAELASICQIHPLALDRLLDSAVALRLLDRRSGGRYGLGALGAPVAADEGLRAMIEHNAVLYEDLRDPLALLRDPVRAAMHAYWPYTESADANAARQWASEAVARYSALMSASQRFVIEELLASYDFRDHRVVLDVGGGQGGWVTRLAQHAPHLQLQLFDLPPVADLARARIDSLGLSGRIEAHGGSFVHDALPTGADLVTLVRVAHDHADEVVLGILRRIHAALPVGGTLLLAEPMADPDRGSSPADPYFHFYLMAMGPGRLRTPQQLMGLMEQAGFCHVEPLPNPMPLHTRLLVGRRSRGLPLHGTSGVNLH